MKRNGKSMWFVLMVLMCCSTLACTARLKTGALDPVSAPANGNLAVHDQADNMKNNIGFGSFTVIAIPVYPIKIEGGEGDRELMRVIKETVEHVGYKTATVKEPSEAAGPVITAKVDKFFFYNYTWLFPLVVNWGTINLTVSVKNPDGTELWSKQYKGNGVGFYDYDRTVNKALNMLLKSLAIDLASPAFQQAVFGAPAAPAPPVSRGEGETLTSQR